MQLKNIDTTLNYIIDVAVETDASLKTFQLTLKVQQSLWLSMTAAGCCVHSTLPSQDVVEPWIQFNVVLVNVVVQVLCAEYFCNSHKLQVRKKDFQELKGVPWVIFKSHE